MERYDSYQDSNIKWLGKVPSHWNIIRVKGVTKLKSVRNKPEERLLSIYREYGVIYKDSRDDNHNVESDNLSNYKFVEPGDLVINKMKAWQGSLAISEFQGIISPAYIICQVDDKKVYPKYLHYLLRSNEYIAGYNSISKGVRIGQWDLHYEDFKNLPLVLPNYQEQISIVSYLEEKLIEIDRYIQIKEKQRDLLEEKLNTIISNTVLQGREKTSLTKETDFNEIGKIPKHWSVYPLYSLATIKARLGWKGLKASEYTEQGNIFLAIPNIKGRFIDFDNVDYISNERYLESPEIMLKEDDVLLAKDGSTLGTVNVVRNLPSQATVNSSIAVIRPNENIDSIFLHYFLKSNHMQNVIKRIKDGMGVPHLFQKDINKFRILVPPLKEQKQIAEYLDNRVEEISNAIELIKKQVTTMKNYKRTLVSSVVTGKVNVHHQFEKGSETGANRYVGTRD
ncbi:restriction endonuclease subunit S [Paucisalibacillus globulus]|jgi:type I restriction enzyme, S subunit|uniref:restriction endonuclease subunit S n=1 Tax=Paucisalibacillus globulus TaxID=351095 RepID=UPI0003FF0B9E|nr:restriction endonuclease subunit S [Paucisalibacillus globulus]